MRAWSLQGLFSFLNSIKKVLQEVLKGRSLESLNFPSLDSKTENV